MNKPVLSIPLPPALGNPEILTMPQLLQKLQGMLPKEEKEKWEQLKLEAAKKEKSETEAWEWCNRVATLALQDLMDYVRRIEYQNYRLNRRIDMLENGTRLLDRMERLIELQKEPIF